MSSPVPCRVADSWLLHPIQGQRAQTLCDDSSVHPLLRPAVSDYKDMQTIRGIQDTILIAEASLVQGVTDPRRLSGSLTGPLALQGSSGSGEK